MAVKFTERLRVNKEIVSLLSTSTYQRSFPSAIREIVSNAYDADALSVKISYDKNLSVIEIEDDGNGMTRSEFKTYLTIAGTKQKSENTRKYKRKRIGQFGVGFLSIFPFCETIEIITTSENSIEILRAKIPAKDFFKGKPDESDKQRKGAKVDTNSRDDDTYIDDIPIFGEIGIAPQERLNHYTIIRLIAPSHIVKQYFKRPKTKRGASIQSFNPQKRLVWELEEDLPISLVKTSKYQEKYKYNEPIGIKVYVNNEELFRHDYLKNVLIEGVKDFGTIKAKYIFTSNYTSIKPEEARGVKMRVNNVGIGGRTDFELRRSRGFPRLHFISGEIFFSEEMKSHLNLSRDGFISNQVTDEIFEYFADILRTSASEVQHIFEAEMTIINASSVRRSIAAKPQSEVLSNSIKKLINRGYKQVTVTNSAEKIVVDKARRIVYVEKNVLQQKETVFVLGNKFAILYDKWSTEDNQPACRFIDKNKIVINQNYPLFKSKSLGGIFRKIHLMLLVGSEKTKSSKRLLELFNAEILKEFKDLKK